MQTVPLRACMGASSYRETGRIGSFRQFVGGTKCCERVPRRTDRQQAVGILPRMLVFGSPARPNGGSAASVRQQNS
jgi:hypothetical protein